MQKHVTTAAPSVKTIEIESVLITPDIAAAWLDKNTDNRTVRRRVVDSYAVDMAAGRWRLTGDPIRFSVSGQLIDGQHRLLACIKSETPFATAVIYGLPEETREVLDIGAKRVAADTFHWQGKSNAKLLASAVRVCLGIKLPALNTFSVPHVVEFVERHPKVEHSVSICRDIHRSLIPAFAAAVHYIGGHVLGDLDRANAMVDVLKHGIPSYHGDPIHLLRNRVLGDAAARRSMPRRDIIVYYIHSWNNFRRGASLTKVLPPRSMTAKFEGLDADKML